MSFIKCCAIIVLSIFAFLLLSSFNLQSPVNKVSMDVTIRTLSNGKSVTGTAEVYFSSDNGGEMLTHTIKPVESFIFINSKGELKVYNPSDNTVMIEPNSGVTSQSSFIYYFLNGSTNDMGLKKSGYLLTDTRFENNMVITTWLPPAVMAGLMGKAELVHENYQPVYLAFFNDKGEPAMKVYYSNFYKSGNQTLPLTVTEFRYRSPADSTIEKKVYSNVKFNNDVEARFSTYRIPENAKVLSR